jgi:hypothetical protein
MRKLLVPSFAFLAFAGLPLCAAAQPAPPETLPPQIPIWGDFETVESNAIPGPALWHISKGDSEVWILGMVGQLPKGVTWNTESLSDVMKGSRVVLMPPRAELGVGGFLSAGWLLVTNCCSLFRLDKGKLDDLLPEVTKVKLSAMRESVGGDAKLYQGDEPFGAGMRLDGDFTRKYDLRGESPMGGVNKLAETHKVKMEPASRFNPLPIVREALKITPQQQLPCLDASMEDTARRAVHARAMAQAWAVGDIKGVKAHYAESRALECIAVTVKSLGALWQSQVPDMVAAIEASLNKPGKAFAVVDMGPLLRKGGVLERLQAHGLTIEAPPE